MSVSYAQVAESPVASPEPASSPAAASTSTTIPVTDAASTSEDQEESHLPSPKQSPKPVKQISLAPAPIPEVNAWGNTSTTSSRSNSNIDAKYWPAASEIDLTQQSQPQQNQQGKKINFKQSNQKWVPFKGAVIVSQSQTRKPNQKRNSSKNNNQNNNQQSNGSATATKSQDKKKKNKDKRQQDKPVSKETGSSAIEQGSESHDQQTPEPKEEQSQPSSENKDNQDQPQQHQNHQQRHFNKHYHQQNGAYQPHQNFNGQRPFRPYNRRYNNRFNSQNPQQPNGQYRGPFVPYGQRRFQHQQAYTFNPSQLTRDQEPLFSLIKQIEYYFSFDNLVKDVYMRKQMNGEGWIPISVIANFKRLSILSAGDLGLVKRAVEDLVELGLLELAEFTQGVLKIRVRENFKQWVLPADDRDINGQDESEPVNLIEKKPVEPQEVIDATQVLGDQEAKEDVKEEVPATE